MSDMRAFEYFAIDGTVFKKPTGFKISRFKVTDLARIANATMVGDLIAKKRKFFFTYAVISSDDMDAILELLWEPDEIFFVLEYKENGIIKEANVYPGEIPTELHKGNRTKNWVWKNVSFNLIEQ